MPTEIESLLQQYVHACLDVFSEPRVTAIVLHGSSYKGGFIPGYSDIDFMVFLAPNCFDEYGMRRDLAFAIQQRTAAIDWSRSGAIYVQAYYYNPDDVPSWWTGPIPGAHRVLHGMVPAHLIATPERLRETGRAFLVDALPAQIRSSVTNWADATEDSLPRRVRLIGTLVNPVIYSLLAIESSDPLSVWTRTRFENLDTLDVLRPDVAALARRYFQLGAQLFGDGDHDPSLLREAYCVALDAVIAAHRAVLGIIPSSPRDPV